MAIGDVVTANPSGCSKWFMAQGLGVEQWFKNGQPSNRIEGDFHDGKLSRGRGVVIFPNGDRYEGQLSDDGKSMKGHGVMTCSNGERLEAEFRPASSAK
jgi:hypothetical protein